MPKICDPPPYQGGQTANVYYDVSFTRTRGDGLVTRFLGGAGTGNWVFGKVTGIKVLIPPPNTGQVMTLVIVGRDGDRNMTMASGNIGYDPNVPASIYTFSDISFELIQYPNQSDTGGDAPSTNCRCSEDSCRVDCATLPDGFCCIDHSVTNRLLQIFAS